MPPQGIVSLSFFFLFLLTLLSLFFVDSSLACYTKENVTKPHDDQIFTSKYLDEELQKEAGGGPNPLMALVMLGGGNDNPSSPASDSGMVLNPEGQLCEPCASMIRLPMKLMRPGGAWVKGGFIVCGGKTAEGKVNKKCWYWKAENKTYFEMMGDLPIDGNSAATGAIRMTNNYLHPGLRRFLFVFVENCDTQFIRGEIMEDMMTINWVLLNKPPPLPDLGAPSTGSCLAALGNHVYLLGGRTKDQMEAIRFGWAADITDDHATSLVWSPPFQLDSVGSMYDSGCAIDFVRSAETKQNALMWITGGGGQGRNRHNAKHVAFADASNGKWIRKFDTNGDRHYAMPAILSFSDNEHQFLPYCPNAECSTIEVDQFIFPDDKIKEITFKEVDQNGDKSQNLGGMAMFVAPIAFFPSCLDDDDDMVCPGRAAGDRRAEVVLTVLAVLLIALFK